MTQLVAEVAFLLIVFAGVWLVAAQIPALKIATHWGTSADRRVVPTYSRCAVQP